MSTTTTEGATKAKRNEYQKQYQAARYEAISALIKQHPQDWGRLFTAAKGKHGFAAASERRLARSKEKAADMLAALKAQGVDVSDLLG